MTTFKKYCKEAKERMRSGFWTETKDKHSSERQTAATLGIDTTTIKTQQRERITLLINSPTEYDEEQAFYDKVVSIIESEETIINPLPLLADQKVLSSLPESRRQGYFLRLADKYQKALAKYNSLKGRK